jgi:hypothetical protein
MSAFLQKVVNGEAIVIEENVGGQDYSDIVVKYAWQNYEEQKIKDNITIKANRQAQILRYMNELLVKKDWLFLIGFRGRVGQNQLRNSDHARRSNNSHNRMLTAGRTVPSLHRPTALTDGVD